MRSAVIVFLSLVAGGLTNIVSPWVEARWGLSSSSHIVTSVAVLCVVAVVLMCLEAGITLPGTLVFHRFWYVLDLARSERLSRWRTKFAPLQLAGRRRYIASAEILDAGERQDLVTFLSQAVTGRRDRAQHLLILGEPGSGKSTAIERLALELAAHGSRRLGLRGPIPVLVDMSGHRPQDDLRTMVSEALGRWTAPSTAKVLTDPSRLSRLLTSSRLVLLFDGLDELSGQRREQALAALATFSSTAAMAGPSVVVTCRTRQDPGTALPGYQTFSILDLSDESLDAFVEAYAKDYNVKPDVVTARLSEGGFLGPGGLGRNPFWLVGLIANGATERARSRLLLAITNRALTAEVGKPEGARRSWLRPSGVTHTQLVEECELALGHLALAMDEPRAIDVDGARAIVASWLAERQRVVGLPGVLVPDHLIELARDAGLLQRNADVVVFSHRLVKEFFAALGLRHQRGELAKWLRPYIDDPNRWQTLALYAGMLEPAARDELIRTILRTDGSPIALACALASYLADDQPASGSVLDELRASLRTHLAADAPLDPQLQKSLRDFLTVAYDAALDFIGRFLTDPNPSVRTRACELIALSESREAIRLLAYVGLDDDDARVSETVSAALVAAGERSTWPVIRQLFARRPEVRTRAAAVLTRTATPHAVNYLLTAEIPTDVAAKALAAASNVGRLLIALVSSDELERGLAVTALGHSSDLRVVDALTRALDDGSEAVHVAAWAALKQRVHGPELIAVLTAAAQRASVVTRTRLLETCAADCRAVDLLLASLEDGNPQIRAAAAQGLASIDEPRVVAALSRVATTDADSRARTSALEHAAVGRATSEADLRLALRHDDGSLGQVAAQVLSRRDRAIAAELIQSDPSSFNQIAAMDAVRDSDAAVLVPALVDRTRAHASGVRQAAARALARHSSDDVTATLCGLLRDTDEQVRLAAVEALAARSEVSVTRALIDLASTAPPMRPGGRSLGLTSWSSWRSDAPRQTARTRAIAALASRPGDDVTAALCALARDDADWSIRAAAVRAMSGRIGDLVDATLREAIADLDAGVNREALAIAITRRDIAATLVPILADETSGVAHDVSEQVGAATDPTVRAALETALPELLRSTSETVRSNGLAAAQSLFASVRYPTNGVTLADLVLDCFRSSDSETAAAAEAAVEAMPAAFLAFSPTLREDAAARIDGVRVLAERCAEPALAVEVAAFVDGHPSIDSPLSGRAIAAVADPYVVAAVMNGLRRGADLQLQEALNLAGPPAWPLLRSCLQKTATPEPLLVAAVRALTKARDTAPKTTAMLLDLLEHRSRVVRAETAVALRDVADQAVQQFGPAIARSTESRQYLEILLSLLEGKSLPHSQTLAWSLAGEAEPTDADVAPAVSGDPDTVGPRMDTHEHLMELARCTGAIAAPALAAGLIGAYSADAVITWLAAAFGVPAAALVAYLPPAPLSNEIVGLACAVWIGVPVTVMKLWQFITPGLYERERRLGLRLIVSLVFAVLITPFVAALAARTIGQFGAATAARIWIATHVSLLALATTVWGIGVRPIWRLLSAQLRVTNVLTMAAGGTTRVLFSEADLLWAVVAMFVVSCGAVFLLPLYVTAGVCAAGFVGCLCLSTAARVAANTGSVAAGAGSYWRGFWTAFLPFGLGAAIAWPIALAWLAFASGVPASICELQYGRAGATAVAVCLSTADAARPWFLFVHASWAVFVVGPLIELPFLVRRWRGAAYLAGCLTVPIVALSPIVVSRLAAEPIHVYAAAAGWPALAANFAVARAALVPALAFLALATARLLTHETIPDRGSVALGVATVVVLGVLPSIVLAVPFAVTFVTLFACAILALIYLPRARLSTRDLLYNVRLAMDEFMKASRELGQRLHTEAAERHAWRETRTASRT